MRPTPHAANRSRAARTPSKTATATEQEQGSTELSPSARCLMDNAGCRRADSLEERLEAVRQDHGARRTLARRAAGERLRISRTEWRRKIDRDPHSSRIAAAVARDGLVIRPSTSQGPRRYPAACWINGGIPIAVSAPDRPGEP